MHKTNLNIVHFKSLHVVFIMRAHDVVWEGNSVMGIEFAPGSTDQPILYWRHNADGPVDGHDSL